MHDAIVREITVKAPKEKVYAAISNPEQITTWFPDSVTGTLQAGSQSTFDFGEDGTAQALIMAATPFEYFSFRWYTGNDANVDVLSVPTTLVEFFIEEGADGTKVTLKESGFSTLPADVAQKSLDDNTGGWKYMMDRLETIFAQA